MTLEEWASAKPAHVSLQQITLQPQKAHMADDLDNYNIFMNMTNPNGNRGTYHQRIMFHFKVASQFY